MIRLQFIFLVIILCIVNQIECSKSIQDLLPGYYASDIVKRFKGEWEKYQHAFENAIETSLQEDFGVSSVNIYEENRPTSHHIAQGFSLTDNIVNVYFFDMVLRELPSLVRPKLKIDLSNNYQNLRSRVGRMFIDSTYYVARNDSSEIYARPEDQKHMSPFSLQQVDRFGKVTIIADNCMLTGISIITLNGDSVNLGHSPMQLKDCQFTVEISTPNSGAPPVIAPYFPNGPKGKLELILTKPIREELQTKLQSALYSYVNTSVLFGPQVREFRENQHDLFKSYTEFIRDYVSKVNQETLKANRGVAKLPNYNLILGSAAHTFNSQCHMSLSDLTLYGLETAYVGRSGGPYNDGSPSTAADAIVFSSMQIRGKIGHVDENNTSEYDFTAELTDIAVNVLIAIKNGRTNIADMKMAGWRSLAFSIIPLETHYRGRVGYQSLVYGHLLNELPTRVLNHLRSILGGTSNDKKKQLNGGGKTDSDGRNEENGQELDTDIQQSDDDMEGDANKKKEFFTDDNIDKDFFTDDNIDKDFFTDDNIDKDFFTDDNIEKDFLSEDNLETDFFSDDNLEKDFLSDDHLEKGFLSDDHLEKGFLSDDHIEKGFLSDDHLEKGFLTDDNQKENNANKQKKVLSNADDNEGKNADNSESNTKDGNDFSIGGNGDGDNLENIENGGLDNGDGDDDGKLDADDVNMTDDDDDRAAKKKESSSLLNGDDDGKLDAVDVNMTGDDDDGAAKKKESSSLLSGDDDGQLDADDVNMTGDDDDGAAKEKKSSSLLNGDDDGQLDADDVNMTDDADDGAAKKKGSSSLLNGDDDEKLDVNVADDDIEQLGSNDRYIPDENKDDIGEKVKLKTAGKDNKAFLSDDFLEKDFFTDLTGGKSKLRGNKPNKLSQSFFSDSSNELRRFALKKNDTANVRVSGQRKDVKEDDLSHGIKRGRTGNNNKKVVRVDNANNKQTTTKTGKASRTAESGSKKAKKPVLPPNVHNRRRLNNSHMSENEIR